MTAEPEAGKAAFLRRDWAAAHAALAGGHLEPEDLERLAVAAFLLGHDDESTRAWEAAHQAWLTDRTIDRALRCAAWLALTHLLQGEVVLGSGWLARAERIVADAGEPGAASGLLLVSKFVVAVAEDRLDDAAAFADEMLTIGQAFDDADVTAFGLLTTGEACVAAGELDAGMRLFDEVMVALAADDVSPITTGIVYCAVIEACVRAFDLRRAAAWTDALGRWVAEQPDLVPFRGACLVHRSQVLLATGAWAEAAVEASRARDLLAAGPHPALGEAVYQQAELHRLRGELGEAERAYRAAGHHGHDPVPGLALLRLAQGDVEAAVAAVGRALGRAGPVPERLAPLAAAVEVFVAAGDLASARAASDELAELASDLAAPVPALTTAYARGTVALAEGRPGEALDLLCAARDQARELALPYEEARARLQLAIACRALGDADAADLELEVAVALLEDLGARLELDRARALARPTPPAVAGLTARECEVLELVAAGRTNREVAATLGISEHTVARHLQNIFTKTGLSSRTAVTAYAYEQGLVGARGQD